MARKQQWAIVREFNPYHSIQKLPVDLSTEDEELGTDHRHGMVATTFGTRTIARRETTFAILERKKI
jgi:hypothetical protein